MAALKSTVASVPAGYVLCLTYASASTGKIDGRGGEATSKVLGAYSGDMLNNNSKRLLGFVKDNKLALLNATFCTLKIGMLHMFESTMRSK